MRIGLVTGEYPPHQGGVGDFSRELALALAALSHDVHIITHRAARPEPGLHIHPVVGRWGLGALLKVRQLARATQLDIVSIQYQAAAFGMTLPIHFLPSALSMPAVVTFHDLRAPYLFPKAGTWRKSALNHLARTCAGVIVTNHGDRLTLESDYAARRIAEIPIGSNVPAVGTHTGSRVREYAARYGFGNGDTVLGYFGFLNMSKGGETLFKALAQAPGLKLLLIGGLTGTSDSTNVAYAAQLDSMAKRLGIADRIARTGFLPPREASEALLACDFMAMPYTDGVSLRRGSFMACLAHGMPTVTVAPRVLIPQLQHRENILFIRPDNPEDLADAMRALAADPGLRARLSAGAARVAGEFTWDKIAEQTLAFFKHVMPAAPVARRRRR